MAEQDTGIGKRDDFVVPELPLATWRPQADPHEGGDAFAPLIFNSWYAVARCGEVDNTLRTIKVLGEPLVYYRTKDGQPIVLDDRCAHRRFPLHKGRLVDDAIQCGYHGFTYEASGRCIWAPGVAMTEQRAAKLPFGVRAYPCAERGPWLWVWMGEAERADPAEIPLPDGAQLEAAIFGYKLNPSNYMLVIENLLDLSHTHFLHQASDLEYSMTVPDDAPAPPNGTAWEKSVERTEAGVLVSFCGDDPKRMIRMEESNAQYGPSLTFGIQERYTLPGDPDPILPAKLHVVHAVTPMDHANTHQFFMLTMSSPFTVPESEIVHVSENIVFEQDVVAVRDMQVNIIEDMRPGRVEFSMAHDRFGVRMRRILKEMKARELESWVIKPVPQM